VACLLLLLAAGPVAAAPGSGALEDVRSACEQIARRCGGLLAAKGVDWPAVRRRFLARAAGVRGRAARRRLLGALLACLHDAHAHVEDAGGAPAGLHGPGALHAPGALRGPDALHGPGALRGPGMGWCRARGHVLVKCAWAGARRVGVEPGEEVLQVDGRPVGRWLEARLAELRARRGFGTPQHAWQHLLQEGLARPRGTRLRLRLRDVRGHVHLRTVVCERAGFAPRGPPVLPAGLHGDRSVVYGRTARGFGYVRYRTCRSDMPYRTDDALRALGHVPGLVLDFRANPGGGFSLEDWVGRFVPKGHVLEFGRPHGSRGPRPYGGPVVVLVDGLTRGAAECACATLAEDGRARLVGESATAGAAAVQETLDLPSGLYRLVVSVRSLGRRFNHGRGLEGLGVRPHEILAYDPRDLAAGRDTLRERAEDLLAAGRLPDVSYDPSAFGWQPPPRAGASLGSAAHGR
jgi:C-terminal processing protease CtpA/Prc